MCRALPPSEPPDGERSHCLRLVVERAQPRGGWYLSAIARLQGFSSGSPAAFPHQWAIWWREASRAAASAPPSASRIFVILAGAEGRLSRGLPRRGLASRFFLQLLGVETVLQLRGGGVLQPCWGRRTAAAQLGCSIPSSARATVASRTRGSHNMSYAARAVLVFWDGPILVLVARTRVRTCRCALGRPTPAGAVLVDRWTPPSVLRWWQPEKVSLPMRLPTPPAPLDLRLPGLNGWFSSLVGKNFSATAFARKPLLQLSCRPGRRSLPLLSERTAVGRLEFVVPQASWYGGCSYPRERNRSPVCNGTLSAGVCSLWLSGPEHLSIWA
jgi:hypothetical protein